MGMTQARCPLCKKRRRKAEPSNTAPEKRWQLVDGQLVCFMCAPQMQFEIGEVINPESMGLQLKISSLAPLEGVIVTNNDPTSYVGKFFPVGGVLRFQRVRDGYSWTIVSDDKDMPWFVLGIYEGRKRFEHYR